jgi:hypothetical protein
MKSEGGVGDDVVLERQRDPGLDRVRLWFRRVLYGVLGLASITLLILSIIRDDKLYLAYAGVFGAASIAIQEYVEDRGSARPVPGGIVLAIVVLCAAVYIALGRLSPR